MHNAAQYHVNIWPTAQSRTEPAKLLKNLFLLSSSSLVSIMYNCELVLLLSDVVYLDGSDDGSAGRLAGSLPSNLGN